MIGVAETYQQTNFKWMPLLPFNWKIERAKAVFFEKSLKGFPNEPLLAASQKQGVVLKTMLEQRSMEAVQSFETFKLVDINDFVISLRSFEGGIELAYYRGIISPVYAVFAFRNSAKHNLIFYKYLFKSRMFIQELNIYKTGIRDGQSISFSEFANIYLPVPPKEEQDEIVQHIKAQEEKINQFIKKKQHFIELLKEQRQRIINLAVTKGVHINAKMKSSGIDWLGDVPQHWKVGKLKRFCQVKRGASPRPIDDPKYFDNDGEYGWVRISDVTASKKYLEVTEQKLSALGQELSVQMEPGDIFLSIAGSVGKPIISNIKCCIHDGFVWFQNLEINKEYLYYIFLSGSCFDGLGKMGTQLNLNTETVGSIFLALPPEKEIEKIIEHIKTETATIDTAIAKAEREIELIKEYKEAMISEAVMGKRNKEISN